MDIPNRLKFAIAGDLFEAINPLYPGQPHQELVRLVDAAAPARVLELCAGTGYVSRLFAETHPDVEVHALDLSPEMLAVGRRKLARSAATIELVEGDASELPYPDGHFDVVMAAFGLHELPPPVRRRAIAEAARVLRGGGRLIAMDLDRPDGPAGRLVDGYLLLFEPRSAGDLFGTGLAEMLTAAGLTVVQHRGADSQHPTQAIVARK